MEQVPEQPADPEEEENVITREVQREFSIDHEVEYVMDESLSSGEEVVVQEGTNGEGVRTVLQTLLNGKVLDEEIVDEEIITHPITEVIHMGIEKPSDVVDIDFDMERFNQEVLALVNEERERVGVEPLYYESELQRGVDIRTLDSIREETLYADHSRPDGSPWYTAFDYLANRPVLVVGENIAYTEFRNSEIQNLIKTEEALEMELAKKFYNQYANSPGHYQNMIQESHEGMAVSTMFANHNNSSFIRAYNTMVFSKRYE